MGSFLVKVNNDRRDEMYRTRGALMFLFSLKEQQGIDLTKCTQRAYLMTKKFTHKDNIKLKIHIEIE